MRYTYCPQCGEKLIDREIGDEGLLPYCVSCERPYFELFGQCVIVAVFNEYDEVVLLRQEYVTKESWVLVAGFVKKGDTTEDTAVREVFEETGQRCMHLDYLKSYYYEKHELLMMGYLMKVKKSAFIQSIEVDDLKWFTLEDALLNLRDGSIAQEHLLNCWKQLKNGGQ